MKNLSYQCPSCKKQISHGNLTRHKKACENGTNRGKSKSCPSCLKTFTRLESLRYHQRRGVCGLKTANSVKDISELVPVISTEKWSNLQKLTFRNYDGKQSCPPQLQKYKHNNLRTLYA